MSQGFMRGRNKRTKSLAYPFLYLIQQFQVATRSTSPDMTTVFHAWSPGRLVKMQSNLRRMKLHRTNQGSNFLGGSFINRDNARAQSNLEEKVNSRILIKDYFSSRTDPSNLTSKLVEFLQNWNQNATSCSSPQCLANQKPILAVAKDQMPDHI